MADTTETDLQKQNRENKEKRDEEDRKKKQQEIDDKEAKKNKPPPDMNDPTSWTSFVKSLFIYFLLTLLVGLVGSNYIYFTTRGNVLDNIFPSDDEFYYAKSYETMKHGAENIVNCKETSSGSFKGLVDNFPYNLIKIKGDASAEQLQKLSLTERLTNWFAKTVAGCFKTNRGLLKSLLDNFNPDGLMGNHVFQIYFACPATILIGGFFSLITGFWSALLSAFSADMKVTIWGGFLLYAWGLCIGLAMVIFLRLMATLFFFPLSQDWKEVTNIMACNVKPLVVLFGFFVCGAAYDTLDPSIAGVMGIVYLCLVVWTLFRYVTKKMM